MKNIEEVFNKLELLGFGENDIALLLQKIEQYGLHHVRKVIKQVEKRKIIKSVFNTLSLNSEIILAALLCCPLLRNEHLQRLLHIADSNLQRAVIRHINALSNLDKPLVTKRLLSRDNSDVHFNAYNLTNKGYKAAMDLVFPNEEKPKKRPDLNITESNHFFLIGDIFCNIVVSATCETTWEKISGLNWYLPHNLYLSCSTSKPYGRPQKKFHDLSPDAIIENETAKIYLEVDCSTKSLNQEKKKLQKYMNYFYSTREKERRNCFLIYSVYTKERGMALQNLFHNGSNDYLLPQLLYFNHSETGKAIKQLLEDPCQIPDQK